MTLPSETQTLIQILAQTDALFWPSRDRFVMRQAQVRQERRQAYAESGLVVHGGGTAADRQAFGRTLDALQSAGLLTIHRTAGRREGVRLSPLGDTVTRRLCGVATLSDAWWLLGLLAETTDAWNGSFPEHLAIGVEEFTGSPEENEQLQNMRQLLVPLLPVRYVSCTGDGDYPRRYWMSVTDEGRAALAGGVPDRPPASVEYSEEAAEAYDAEWQRYAAELAQAEPERPGDLCLPIPCGIGWGSLKALLEAKP